jgi:hypothetical protein
MLQSKNTYYQLADAQLQVICMQHMTFTEACCACGDFSAAIVQTGHVLGQLWSYCVLV